MHSSLQIVRHGLADKHFAGFEDHKTGMGWMRLDPGESIFNAEDKGSFCGSLGFDDAGRNHGHTHDIGIYGLTGVGINNVMLK